MRVAVRNWQRVRSGFFSPMLQTELGQEQMADAGQNQMPTNGEILADLEVVHAQLALAVFENSLDAPAAVGHQQQDLQRNGLRSIGEEELHLVRMQHGADEDQLIGARRQTVGVLAKAPKT